MVYIAGINIARDQVFRIAGARYYGDAITLSTAILSDDDTSTPYLYGCIFIKAWVIF